MPSKSDVRTARLAICHGCGEWRGRCRLGHSVDSLQACPLGKFIGFVPLGDLVAAVAKPVARLLGRPTCVRCTQRQEILNRVVRRL